MKTRCFLLLTACFLLQAALAYGQDDDGGVTFELGGGGTVLIGDGGDIYLGDVTVSNGLIISGPTSTTSGTVLSAGTLDYGGADFTGSVLLGDVTGSGTQTYDVNDITLQPTTGAPSLDLTLDPQVFTTGLPVLVLTGGDLTLSFGTLTFSGTAPANFSAASAPFINGSGNYEIPSNMTFALPSATTTTILNTGLTFDLATTLSLSLDTQTDSIGTLSVQGDLTFNGTNLLLTDLAASSQTLAPGTTFTLIHYTGTESGVLSINGQAAPDGSTFTYGANTYQIDYASGDPDVVIEAIPEPPIWSLLPGGFAAVVFLFRRRLAWP